MGGHCLVPEPATIVGIRPETASGDVRTFDVILDDPKAMGAFNYMPGQCGMISIFGVGECMISITSSPTRPDVLQFAVKRIGLVTDGLHELPIGAKIGLRGPYGNHFPVSDWVGRDLLFVGGGIGLAPLRSVINYCLDKRQDYGAVDIVYGARTPSDLCFKDELTEIWPSKPDARVYLTVDREDKDWSGNVGFVPQFLEGIGINPDNRVAITCGPPIMIKLVMQTLSRLGFPPDRVITTLEMKMQCGVGKCGRCNVGSKYICVDGPVFSGADLANLPQEF